MLAVHDLRARLVDADNSFGAKMRMRRWQLLQETFPDLGSLDVLDLGGTVESWLRAPMRPAHVHVVNLEKSPPDPPAWITTELADACELGPEFSRRTFDVVYSNSVIEHVGGHHRRVQLAAVIRRSARRYWVQTPYRYFPIEPHFLFPGFQFLPVAARSRILARWPLLHTPSRDRSGGVSTVLATELIGWTEMQHYFPDATIHAERVAGLPKSLIAVKR